MSYKSINPNYRSLEEPLNNMLDDINLLRIICDYITLNIDVIMCCGYCDENFVMFNDLIIDENNKIYEKYNFPSFNILSNIYNKYNPDLNSHVYFYYEIYNFTVEKNICRYITKGDYYDSEDEDNFINEDYNENIDIDIDIEVN